MKSSWETIPELTDEFEGTNIDPLKWWDHNPHWQGRPPALFVPENVAVRNGQLLLMARAEEPLNPPDPSYHTFTTAAVKSKAKVLYGYFEIKCRAMRSKASSAFWFYDNIDGHWWTEIDVFEMAGGDPTRRRAVLMNAHVFYTPDYRGEHIDSSSRWEMADDVAVSTHVYSLLWTAKTLRWYVDLQCVKMLENHYWHQPLHMNFDVETHPNWFGLPDPAELPAIFSIEYVRSWRHRGGYDHDDLPLPLQHSR